MSDFQGLNIVVQKQLYSFIALLKEKRLQLLIATTAIVVITFFLYDAEPYNISLWQDRYKIFKLSGFGFIYVVTICLCLLFTPQNIIYPVVLSIISVFRLGVLFVLVVLCAGVFSWLYTVYIYEEYPADAFSLFKSIKHVFSFSLFFLLYYIGYLLWCDKKYRLKQHRKMDTITLDKFTVIPTDILLIKSDENYIFLHYMLENSPKKIHLRYKISDAEKQLSAYNQFVRVQKSYLVNMMYVNREDLDRNPKLLKIDGIDERIVIGKTFKRNLKKWQELVINVSSI
ncbi:LytTr DNA-binding region [Paludibacter propionicigenes WB4]|uniref:LytTr DNA-binding region n=1 Tax=Paludibacter propionicigenes (strain DSM 17365 / JCM 13257 / WB4) TaxID=694427 RepID=E4T3I5_PALPW|nr:LytTR family DNA-binding domain-containing protein [Paludibacter propionicigenes]ADQ79279.1 LytTr DNA-binding region [Paludibacter propionicigenes WB4]